jgi:hypothetical protein
MKAKFFVDEDITCQIYHTKSEFVNQSSTPSIGLNTRQKHISIRLKKVKNLEGKNWRRERKYCKLDLRIQNIIRTILCFINS